jgi:hypothetical protein
MALLLFICFVDLFYDRYVREAIIFAFCMIIISVSPIHLINEMSLQLIEFQLWLKGMSFLINIYLK